ncbi:MMPL family transporter [Luteimonas mephitis]|uniref:MMPL family transporter n=1 Tax=Luteimonas mephitis TaxID=83615 RepID=UPI000414734C|nr:MMPL family transporter [Luteimonas mephitis]
MDARLRFTFALLWLALLLLAGWWISAHLQLTGDLRKFMPAPETPEQKLLIDELGEGPGSRLLLVALSGADAPTLAAQSKALHAALAADDQFALVANGDADLDAIPERLRPYRYLLSPTLDAQPLDAAYLAGQLDERVQDLGSPAGALVEPLVGSDPTLETLKVAEALQPANAPQRVQGVWFDRAGKRALLVVQTRAAGFDPTGQQRAVDAINAAYAKARGNGAGAMVLSGPGAFSVEIGGRTEAEAQWIGTFDTIGLVVLLIVAYRSWKIPVLGVLPLASAGLAGLGAVALLFDGVHGITVAFGFTLIGVVQDYPIHLFSHQRPGVTPLQNARALWPTLATGVVSTCIAYFTFLFSGVDGLQQLAVFTVAGLLVAALSTRLLLPRLIDPTPRDFADSRLLARMWAWTRHLPRPRWSLLAFALAALAATALAPGAFWQNDLSKLTPVPADALARDADLRAELGAPDVRYVLTLQGRDDEAVLEASERLRPALDQLVRDGALAGYDMAARYLPSAAVQRARQQSLPDAATLRAALDAALADSPFRADVFGEFVDDVAKAKALPPLLPAQLAGTPLETAVGGLLLGGSGHATALVSLAGLEDPAEVARVARLNGAALLDMKAASESLVVAYRGRVLAALAVASLLLALTVWIAMRLSVLAQRRVAHATGAPLPPRAGVSGETARRTARVLLPMALTTLLILAVLRLCGVELTLFHLVALILAAGLGLDYALFFDHAGDDYADQLRTLHALIVCSLMTLLVFFLLALSSIPVLRAIGSTVALGVFGNFVLALLISRQPATPNDPDAAGVSDP